VLHILHGVSLASAVAYLLTQEFVAVALYLISTAVAAAVAYFYSDVIRRYARLAVEAKRVVRRYLPPDLQNFIDGWIKAEEALAAGMPHEALEVYASTLSTLGKK
jgi:uncharacterized membrane protein